MPRKKTIQPEPLETIVFEDFIIEIRDHHTRLIARGSDKQWKVDSLVDGILAGLIDVIQKGNETQVRQVREMLENPRGIPKFIKQLQLDGYTESERTLRKYAEKARARWQTLLGACLANGKDPYKKR